jgi:hypothetical protein
MKPLALIGSVILKDDGSNYYRENLSVWQGSDQRGKFVIGSKDGDYAVVFFKNEEEGPHHWNIALLLEEVGFSFVGGGEWFLREDGFSVIFDSSSCMRLYGYDAPEDLSERTRLLDEARCVLQMIM